MVVLGLLSGQSRRRQVLHEVHTVRPSVGPAVDVKHLRRHNIIQLGVFLVIEERERARA